MEENWEDEELNYEVNVDPKRNESLLAKVRLRFQDGAIVVNQEAIYRNWKGECMFSIISEFLAELKEWIMQQYEEKLEQQHREESNKQTSVR